MRDMTWKHMQTFHERRNSERGFILKETSVHSFWKSLWRVDREKRWSASIRKSILTTTPSLISCTLSLQRLQATEADIHSCPQIQDPIFVFLWSVSFLSFESGESMHPLLCSCYCFHVSVTVPLADFSLVSLQWLRRLRTICLQKSCRCQWIIDMFATHS